MRAVVQRVSRAAVAVDGGTIGAIQHGLLAYVAAAPDDGDAEVEWIARKLAEIRILADDAGQMNRSVIEAGGALLLIPQFTLYADTRKGRRPSFVGAARPEVAEPLLERLAGALRERGLRVERGRFGAHMLVDAVNDGPITIIVDSSDLKRPRRG
ncbi:MAG: D-tyrosyl-tRNA(Tyr) deacylase [Chloroflexi bacterium]|nr:D-tyrosyl-tRNA(Tyr) deacylase [Chloroflexota bacterium]MBM4434556.1 D-tyrosyl-tRNA(Tyr) deacylase [Chloroflexota bacterium]